MPSSSKAKHAIIFGSSGVSGWALVNELLHDYPEKGTWSRVTALTNRPLDRKTTLWPDDPRLNLVSGVDLLAGSQEELDETMKRKIPEVHTVTHVYYYGECSWATCYQLMEPCPDLAQPTKPTKTCRKNCKMRSIC